MLEIVRLKFKLTAQFLLSQRQARIKKCRGAVAQLVERPSKRSQTGATQLTDVGFETRWVRSTPRHKVKINNCSKK